MGVFPIEVHEMFHSFRCFRTGLTAIAQISDKARIVRGETPELGPGHAGFSQETFDTV
jgi:hypothetical protein